jgi:hypothetical protein
VMILLARGADGSLIDSSRRQARDHLNRDHMNRDYVNRDLFLAKKDLLEPEPRDHSLHGLGSRDRRVITTQLQGLCEQGPIKKDLYEKE